MNATGNTNSTDTECLGPLLHQQQHEVEKECEQLKSPPVEVPTQPLRVVFIHLDWGIGGAEQLMLQLCTATKQIEENNHAQGGQQLVDIHLVTSYCNPNHCFASLQPDSGILYPYLKVWGSWIPSHVIANKGKAIMSTIRLLYLACRIVHHPIMSKADVMVVDVLPTPLWILRFFCPTASLLFYCHFPDQLLIRNSGGSNNNQFTFKSALLTGYRKVLNYIEEQSMILADNIIVNSKFTQQTVRQTFRSLQNHPLPILYPALEIYPSVENNKETSKILFEKQSNLIVSLNRFERKKNLGLLIEAMSWVQHHHPKIGTSTKPTQLVIAGGYDKHNIENIEYRIELQQLANQLHVQVDFRQSISDTERTELLHTATVVVYTPTNEHFGIVPLEAMYAGTPVIACNSGGPIETILHEQTGFLCEPTPEAFGTALAELLYHPDRASSMGQAGHDHVLQKFGPDRLQSEWQDLLFQTIEIGRARQLQYQNLYRVITPRTFLYLFESLVVLILCLCATWLFQYFTVLKPQQSLLSGIRRFLGRDEL
jgi:alpha-1,3/alpha-1,6-mannosyltransferase